MIVRLMGQGQYEVPEGIRERLNSLDTEAMTALEAGEEATLDAKLDEMWQLVEREGKALPDESLDPSDVVIPPSDLTLDETRKLFSEDGLIPELPVA